VIECRQGALLAGIPKTVPIRCVNRVCSSGLQAIADIAASIKSGYIDMGVACGVESMSMNKFEWNGSTNVATQNSVVDGVKSCYLTMGETSERVAQKFGVSRKEQDEFAALSHQRASSAIKQSRFVSEIVPVETAVVGEDGSTKSIVVSTDGGVREGTTAEALSRLKPAFRADGSTTAGNCSQLSDGAAACLMTTRKTAARLGLPVLAVFRSFVAVGVDPDLMGIAPSVAIPEAIKRAGLTMQDVDLYELNEAFASQALYCINKLKLNLETVNVNGGAIALGHPLGCTGTRMTVSLVHEMRRRKVRQGVVSMCVGSGMGAAAVFECEYV